MPGEIEEYIKTKLKKAAKKLLIESVDINIVYKAFPKLSKGQIDDIEVEASEIRRKNLSREYWHLYYEEHKDDPNDLLFKFSMNLKKRANENLKLW